MTGFGVGEAPLAEGRLALEVRSLNHRFLDVRVRLPAELSDQCFFLEQIARARLVRGRYDVGVRLEGAALQPLSFDTARARAAYRALLALRDELAPGTVLPLSAIAAIPDLFTAPSNVDSDAVQRSLTSALDSALARLNEMRHTEGEALGREIGARLRAARDHCHAIAARSTELVDAYRARLHARLERLLRDTGVPLENGRLETEVALMADRSDVTEELVRLESHFAQFEDLMAESEPVGRRLDFLLQEVAREINTIGSKVQDAPIALVVVQMKAEVERLREQVQNVE
jgi:uncharacterized protein (TIGR00255 family)